MAASAQCLLLVGQWSMCLVQEVLVHWCRAVGKILQQNPDFAVRWLHVFTFPGNYQLPVPSYLFQRLSKPPRCLLQLMAEECSLRHRHFWRKSSPFFPGSCASMYTSQRHSVSPQPRQCFTGITIFCASVGLCRGLIPATLPGVQLTSLMQGKLKGFKARFKSLESSPYSHPVFRTLLTPCAIPC